MAIPFHISIDLTKNEVQNALWHKLAADPSTPVEGQFYYDTVNKFPKVHNGSGFKQIPYVDNDTPAAETIGATAVVGTSGNGARADHRHAMPSNATTSVDGFMSAADKTKLDNAVSAATASRLVIRDANGRAQFADPVAAADAATRGYVDGLINGTSWKNSVRGATVSALALTARTSTTLTIGGTTFSHDGLTYANNDTIFVKDTPTGSGAGAWDIGVYTVGGIGTSVVLTRRADMDTWAELVSSAFSIQQGTANADKRYVLTVDTGGTLGTTAVTWVDITSGTIAADSVDNTKLANMATGTIKGRTSAGTGDPEDLTAAQVRTLIGSQVKYAADIGNGALTSIPVTHNLGTKDITVKVWENTGSFREVLCEQQNTSTTVVTLVFAVAPASNALRVVVTG